MTFDLRNIGFYKHKKKKFWGDTALEILDTGNIEPWEHVVLGLEDSGHTGSMVYWTSETLSPRNTRTLGT